MAATSTSRFVDALLDGTLEDRLRAMAGAGLSYGATAATLNRDLPDDCAIDPATVRRYMREYGIETDDP